MNEEQHQVVYGCILRTLKDELVCSPKKVLLSFPEEIRKELLSSSDATIQALVSKTSPFMCATLLDKECQSPSLQLSLLTRHVGLRRAWTHPSRKWFVPPILCKSRKEQLLRLLANKQASQKYDSLRKQIVSRLLLKRWIQPEDSLGAAVEVVFRMQELHSGILVDENDVARVIWFAKYLKEGAEDDEGTNSKVAALDQKLSVVDKETAEAKELGVADAAENNKQIESLRFALGKAKYAEESARDEKNERDENGEAESLVALLYESNKTNDDDQSVAESLVDLQHESKKTGCDDQEEGVVEQAVEANKKEHGRKKASGLRKIARWLLFKRGSSSSKESTVEDGPEASENHVVPVLNVNEQAELLNDVRETNEVKDTSDKESSTIKNSLVLVSDERVEIADTEPVGDKCSTVKEIECELSRLISSVNLHRNYYELVYHVVLSSYGKSLVEEAGKLNNSFLLSLIERATQKISKKISEKSQYHPINDLIAAYKTKKDSETTLELYSRLVESLMKKDYRVAKRLALLLFKSSEKRCQSYLLMLLEECSERKRIAYWLMNKNLKNAITLLMSCNVVVIPIRILLEMILNEGINAHMGLKLLRHYAKRTVILRKRYAVEIVALTNQYSKKRLFQSLMNTAIAYGMMRKSPLRAAKTELNLKKWLVSRIFVDSVGTKTLFIGIYKHRISTTVFFQECLRQKGIEKTLSYLELLKLNDEDLLRLGMYLNDRILAKATFLFINGKLKSSFFLKLLSGEQLTYVAERLVLLSHYKAELPSSLQPYSDGSSLIEEYVKRYRQENNLVAAQNDNLVAPRKKKSKRSRDEGRNSAYQSDGYTTISVKPLNDNSEYIRETLSALRNSCSTFILFNSLILYEGLTNSFTVSFDYQTNYNNTQFLFELVLLRDKTEYLFQVILVQKKILLSLVSNGSIHYSRLTRRSHRIKFDVYSRETALFTLNGVSYSHPEKLNCIELRIGNTKSSRSINSFLGQIINPVVVSESGRGRKKQRTPKELKKREKRKIKPTLCNCTYVQGPRLFSSSTLIALLNESVEDVLSLAGKQRGMLLSRQLEKREIDCGKVSRVAFRYVELWRDTSTKEVFDYHVRRLREERFLYYFIGSPFYAELKSCIKRVTPVLQETTCKALRTTRNLDNALKFLLECTNLITDETVKVIVRRFTYGESQPEILDFLSKLSARKKEQLQQRLKEDENAREASASRIAKRNKRQGNKVVRIKEIAPDKKKENVRRNATVLEPPRQSAIDKEKELIILEEESSLTSANVFSSANKRLLSEESTRKIVCYLKDTSQNLVPSLKNLVSTSMILFLLIKNHELRTACATSALKLKIQTAKSLGYAFALAKLSNYYKRELLKQIRKRLYEESFTSLFISQELVSNELFIDLIKEFAEEATRGGAANKESENKESTVESNNSLVRKNEIVSSLPATEAVRTTIDKQTIKGDSARVQKEVKSYLEKCYRHTKIHTTEDTSIKAAHCFSDFASAFVVVYENTKKKKELAQTAQLVINAYYKWKHDCTFDAMKLSVLRLYLSSVNVTGFTDSRVHDFFSSLSENVLVACFKIVYKEKHVTTFGRELYWTLFELIGSKEIQADVFFLCYPRYQLETGKELRLKGPVRRKMRLYVDQSPYVQFDSRVYRQKVPRGAIIAVLDTDVVSNKTGETHKEVPKDATVQKKMERLEKSEDLEADKTPEQKNILQRGIGKLKNIVQKMKENSEESVEESLEEGEVSWEDHRALRVSKLLVIRQRSRLIYYSAERTFEYKEISCIESTDVCSYVRLHDDCLLRIRLNHKLLSSYFTKIPVVMARITQPNFDKIKLGVVARRIKSLSTNKEYVSTLDTQLTLYTLCKNELVEVYSIEAERIFNEPFSHVVHVGSRELVLCYTKHCLKAVVLKSVTTLLRVSDTIQHVRSNGWRSVVVVHKNYYSNVVVFRLVTVEQKIRFCDRVENVQITDRRIALLCRDFLHLFDTRLRLIAKIRLECRATAMLLSNVICLQTKECKVYDLDGVFRSTIPDEFTEFHAVSGYIVGRNKGIKFYTEELEFVKEMRVEGKIHSSSKMLFYLSDGVVSTIRFS